MPVRVSFLVDGFNVYHSLSELHDITGAHVKWLDLPALCNRYLHAIRKPTGGERVEVAAVHFFSARPDFMLHRKPETVQRYDTYMAALTASGVKVISGKFKRKTMTCPRCKGEFISNLEKETDVAIAVALFDVFIRDECDTAVLVTGDTDLIPAVKCVRGIFPRNKIGAAFPLNRRSAELEEAVDYHFGLNQKDIERCQFPNPVVGAKGPIYKPLPW